MNKPLVAIVIYRFSGRQLFFRIPDRWCVECDRTVRIAQQVVKQLGVGNEIRITVKPWLNNLLRALGRGGGRPPVVLINGKRFSQGAAPDKNALAIALEHATQAAKEMHDDRVWSAAASNNSQGQRFHLPRADAQHLSEVQAGY